jgi:hypothetical protein
MTDFLLFDDYDLDNTPIKKSHPFDPRADGHLPSLAKRKPPKGLSWIHIGSRNFADHSFILRQEQPWYFLHLFTGVFVKKVRMAPR